MSWSRVFAVVIHVVILGLCTTPAKAQLTRGAIYGTVTDSIGAVLPDVTVDLLSDATIPKQITTGALGEYAFAALDPGFYTLRIEASGFVTFEVTDIPVGVGTSASIPASLSVAGPQAAITVTGRTPILDERSYGNAARVDEETLNRIPTARDPWVLMQFMPGVLVDRINIGGSESGQQTRFTARSDPGGSNTM